MRFHPEVPLVALLRLVLQDDRVHDRASREAHPFRLQVQVHLPQNLFAQLLFFQQVPELAHRGLIGHRLAA
jgi:hypothetical protein